MSARKIEQLLRLAASSESDGEKLNAVRAAGKLFVEGGYRIAEPDVRPGPSARPSTVAYRPSRKWCLIVRLEPGKTCVLCGKSIGEDEPRYYEPGTPVRAHLPCVERR